MAFKIRYQCGENLVGDAETSETLEEAYKVTAAKTADLDHEADIAIICIARTRTGGSCLATPVLPNYLDHSTVDLPPCIDFT